MSVLAARIRQGEFIRGASGFRNWVTVDGSPGPSGEGGFVAQPDRYHLYVSYACPWAHRTLIFLTLKGLHNAISVSVLNPIMSAGGWQFDGYEDATLDHVYQAKSLRENYLRADPDYKGRITVPVLWDKHQDSIVSNESSEIIRMLNSAFDEFADHPNLDLYPRALRAEIDSINETIYNNVNNGVYRAGFATSQEAYERAFDSLFDTLDELEERLTKRRYLLGNDITEADWRLFTTLVRFDLVYFGHFKTNQKRLVDYPNLWAYTRELYQFPGIAETVQFDHIKSHYYVSQASINPNRIVPKGPVVDFRAKHQRDELFSHAVNRLRSGAHVRYQ